MLFDPTSTKVQFVNGSSKQDAKQKKLLRKNWFAANNFSSIRDEDRWDDWCGVRVRVKAFWLKTNRVTTRFVFSQYPELVCKETLPQMD
jgi:hypothetical protein